MKKRIFDFLVRLLEKHGELLLTWNRYLCAPMLKK